MIITGNFNHDYHDNQKIAHPAVHDYVYKQKYFYISIKLNKQNWCKQLHHDKCVKFTHCGGFHTFAHLITSNVIVELMHNKRHCLICPQARFPNTVETSNWCLIYVYM